MKFTPKMKGLLIIIVFILLLILPASYALIREYMQKHTTNEAVPVQGPVNK